MLVGLIHDAPGYLPVPFRFYQVDAILCVQHPFGWPALTTGCAKLGRGIGAAASFHRRIITLLASTATNPTWVGNVNLTKPGRFHFAGGDFVVTSIEIGF